MQIFRAIIICLVISGSAIAQTIPLRLQREYIAANVPSQEVFASYMERDLLAYFRAKVSPDVTSITSVMLRDGATQSGVAYPKFYLWVQVHSKSGALVEGAVRVAAVDRMGFVITQFISSSEAVANPALVSSTFPAALVPAIMAKATAP